MNKKTWTALAASIVVFAAGLFVTLQTRADAIVKGAAASATVSFALGLILTLLGLLGAVVSLLPERKSTDVRTLTLAAIFAALCYVGFTYLRIDIPVGTEKTAFHLGNVFCVLAALFVGGFWGGMAGAIRQGDPRGVNAEGGHPFAGGDNDIGGGKAEGVAEMVSLDDTAGKGELFFHKITDAEAAKRFCRRGRSQRR